MKSFVLRPLAGLAVLAAITGFILLRFPGHSQNASPAADIGPSTARKIESSEALEELRELRSELAALKASIAAHGVTTGSPQQETARSKSELPAGASALDTQTDAAAARQEDERRFAEHVAAIATAFSREPRDLRWSSETDELLESLLNTEELRGLHYQNIDCRTTTCRVEIEDDGSGRAAEIFPLLAIRTATTLPSITMERIEQGDGRATMVLYMSRAEKS
jgi:ribosomal protein L29